MQSEMEDAHVAALLEEVRGQFKVFGEALQSTREELGRKIDAVASDVGVLKTDVAVLKTDVAVLKTDMHAMNERMTRVEHRLNGAPPPAPARRRRK